MVFSQFFNYYVNYLETTNTHIVLPCYTEDYALNAFLEIENEGLNF